MREYTTPEREARVIELKIDGEVYVWTKPKNAAVALPVIDTVRRDASQQEMDLANMRALFDWIGAGLSDEQEEQLEARLRDPDDRFDIDDLNGIAEIIIEELAEVPPTLPAGSSPQPATTG